MYRFRNTRHKHLSTVNKQSIVGTVDVLSTCDTKQDNECRESVINFFKEKQFVLLITHLYTFI